MAGRDQRRVSWSRDVSGERGTNDETYRGPCRRSSEEAVERKIIHPERHRKPNPNYMLLGEVGRELQAAKARTKNERHQASKSPRRLNASSLLEELVNSEKWKILSSSVDQPDAGAKKRRAPQPPRPGRPGESVEAEIFRPTGKLPTSSKSAAGSRAIRQASTITIDEDYMNASEVKDFCHAPDTRDTYDVIPARETNSRPIEDRLHASQPVQFVPPPASPRLIRPSIASLEIDAPSLPQTSDSISRKLSAARHHSCGNVFFLSRDEAEKPTETKRSDDSTSDGTVKLLPSDIRKQRIWLSLNPGTKASQATGDQVDHPANQFPVAVTPWGGFPHAWKPTTHHHQSKGGYTRFDSYCRGGSIDRSRWPERLLSKSNKACRSDLQIPVMWLVAIILLSAGIGFILGFFAAWFGRPLN